MDPHLIGYPLLATRMGVVVVEKTDESDQWYEDFQCWLSSGERGPQSSPVTPHRNPVTPQPSPVSSEGDEPGQGRKVSFFDDVTVYVFDQESPTRELQSHWPETNSKETKGQSPIPIYRHTPETNDLSPIPPCSYVNHLPHMATSGVCLKDNGHGLEWEDDFSFLDSSLKTKMADHHLIISESSIFSASPHQPSTSSHQRWSCPSTHACSQLRPSSLVLTHVTDADLEQ
ncbi:class A basic helix-loop-helix protein 15 isoform X1 [Oncorhynchus mykiss]|uniref:class A basic helix-loop-helix protein 15 isoform X1 n=1 Tax=Oncorhynchus mykiss TaxID=8022 RepID=UPI000B4F38D9|nr:class A basic helix-loop-helix protein 15 isoform X1 [Oncorhynchus mykiss]XP_021431835.1 class A basic helix-loop-helix protein 15 isoform X1 [Oncorhynchus mykiss]XP_021431836.1 class A basic helix-loop-helix protein 15 isoform X1 [Oncorhynchus mykiss]